MRWTWVCVCLCKCVSRANNAVCDPSSECVCVCVCVYLTASSLMWWRDTREESLNTAWSRLQPEGRQTHPHTHTHTLRGLFIFLSLELFCSFTLSYESTTTAVFKVFRLSKDKELYNTQSHARDGAISDTRRLEFLKLPTNVNLVNIINYWRNVW